MRTTGSSIIAIAARMTEWSGVSEELVMTDGVARIPLGFSISLRSSETGSFKIGADDSLTKLVV
jgi:hypothetical protein